ncbi:MAG: gamma carbonic anhydrase family protein [Gammaproteobacteria bacterium]|nr:MAG: gamma carbonic anhydrase family protein [Gammaproteobacteria bacterium]
MIRSFEKHTPRIAPSAFIDDRALVIGDVEVGEESSLWPMAVARGDIHAIRIGRRTNIQDGSVLHVTHASEFDPGHPLVIGDDVTVGHRVVLHACTVGDLCLVGMGSVVLDGAVLEDEVMLGAGSLVPPGKVLEGGFLWLGSPVKKARPLTEKERAFLRYSAAFYAELKDRHRG